MYKYIIHQKEIKKRLETCGLKRHIFNHTVKLMCSFIKNLAVLKLRFNTVDIDNDTLKKLRVKCIREINGTNGKLDFEEINRYQKSWC